MIKKSQFLNGTYEPPYIVDGFGSFWLVLLLVVAVFGWFRVVLAGFVGGFGRFRVLVTTLQYQISRKTR